MKPEKLTPEEWLDPIARENYRRQQETYEERLFQPMWDESGPQWNLEWTIEGLLPKGYLALLAGPPKSGKSCLATAIALSVATGVPFAGRPTKQGAVLWISAEEGPVERNLLLRTSPLAHPETPIFTCYNQLNIDDDEDLLALYNWINNTQAALIVVDPLLGAISGRSLNDSWAARKTLKKFKAFCAMHNVPAIVLHHNKRGADDPRRRRVADNDQLAATASMNLVMKSRTPIPNRPDANLVTITCDGRGNWANRILHLVSLSPLEYQPTGLDEFDYKPDDKLTPSEQQLIETLKEAPGKVPDLVERSGIPEKTIRNAFTRLRRKGLLRVEKNGGRGRTYSLAQ